MSGKLSNSPVRSAEASRLPQANSRNRYPNALPDFHWDAVQRSDFTGDRCETRCTLELQVGKWPGIDFSIAREDISSETDWKILDNRHTVVVHLNGPIHKLETELDGSGGTHEPPMSGELWIIPAERRYFSCARGAIVHFAEVYLQPKFLDELLGKHVDTQTVRARTGHYDHFLYHCVQRLASLIG